MLLLNGERNIEIKKKVAVFYGTEMFEEIYCHFFCFDKFYVEKESFVIYMTRL